MSAFFRFLNTMWQRYFILLLLLSAQAVTAERRKKPINEFVALDTLSNMPFESIRLANWIYHPVTSHYQAVLRELKRIPLDRSKWVEANMIYLTTTNKRGSTFLHDLISNNEIELFKDLLQYLPGESLLWLPKVDDKDILEHAIALKKLEFVDAIGQAIMNPRYSLKTQHALLPYLINHGSVENFESLISSGKIPVNLVINYILKYANEPDKSYKISLLNYILVSPNISPNEMIKVLIKYQVDVNLIPKESLDSKPDWHPVTGNVIAMNFKADANTSLVMESFSPLMLSLQIGLDDITELLLNAGANPNQANHKGILPVHIISQKNDTNAFNLLLKHGLYLNSEQQQSAIDVAKKEGFNNYIDLMKDFGKDNSSNSEIFLLFTTFLTTLSTGLLLKRIFKRQQRPQIIVIDQELYEEIFPPESSFLKPLKDFIIEVLNLPAELDSRTLTVDISLLETKKQISIVTEKLTPFTARQYPEQDKEVNLDSNQLKRDLQQLINACQGIHCDIESSQLIVHLANPKRKNTGPIRSLLTKLTHACFEGSFEFQAVLTKRQSLELIEEMAAEIKSIHQHYDKIPQPNDILTYPKLSDNKVNKWIAALKTKQSSYSSSTSSIRLKLDELDNLGLKNQNLQTDIEVMPLADIIPTLNILAADKKTIQEIREQLSRQFNSLKDIESAMEELHDKIHRAIKELASPAQDVNPKLASPTPPLQKQENKPAAHSRGKEEQEVDSHDAANEASYAVEALDATTEIIDTSAKKTSTEKVIIIKNNAFSLFPHPRPARQSAHKLSAERLQELKDNTVLHLNNASDTISSIEDLNLSDPVEQAMYRHKLSYDLMHCCLALHNLFIQTGKSRQANIAILLRHMLCHLPQEAQLNELCNLAIDIKYFVDTQFKSAKEMDFKLRFENSELFQELWPKWNDKSYIIPEPERCADHIAALARIAAKISANIERIEDIQALSVYQRDALRMILASIGEYLKNLKSQHQALWKSFDLKYKGIPMESEFITFRNCTFHNLAWSDTEKLFKLAKTCVSWVKSQPEINFETYPQAASAAIHPSCP